MVLELSRKAIYETAHGSLDPDDFSDKNGGYPDRYYKAKDRITKLEQQKSEKQHKRIVLEIFIKNLSAKKRTLDSFNNKIWMVTSDRVLVSTTGQLTFRFMDGMEICR